jgi:hypothetical protein
MCGSNQQNYTFDLDYIPEDELLQLYQDFSEYVTYYPNMKKIGQITKHIYSSKQVLSDPIEITFSTDFLIDYKFCDEKDDDENDNEKEIIVENLTDSPSLEELANKVGISLKKLKEGNNYVQLQK